MNEAGEVTQEITDKAKFRFSDMQLHGLAAVAAGAFYYYFSVLIWYAEQLCH
jgi:hypothetical protein